MFVTFNVHHTNLVQIVNYVLVIWIHKILDLLQMQFGTTLSLMFALLNVQMDIIKQAKNVWKDRITHIRSLYQGNRLILTLVNIILIVSIAPITVNVNGAILTLCAIIYL